MKNGWRKWSYEIPLTIGDALWEVLVVQFAAFLDRLTIRKVIEFAVIAMLVMAFAQTLPIDLAILFAGDTLMYLEFVVAIRLAAGKMHILDVLRFALRLARLAMRALNAVSPSGSRRKPDRSRDAAGVAAAATRPSRVSATSASATVGGAGVRSGSEAQPASRADGSRNEVSRPSW